MKRFSYYISSLVLGFALALSAS
jgi:hypothetical protein